MNQNETFPSDDDRGWRTAPRISLRWSSRDDHRPALAALALAVALGLLFRSLPGRFDLMHTFEHRIGLMAPTCGLTRAGLALLQGNPGRAWTYNPAIYLVALVTLTLGARLVIRALGGRWLSVGFHIGRPGALGLWAFFLALWLNQQAHFELLAG